MLSKVQSFGLVVFGSTLTIFGPVSLLVEAVSSFSLRFQIVALEYLEKRLEKASVFRGSAPAFTVLSSRER